MPSAACYFLLSLALHWQPVTERVGHPGRVLPPHGKGAAAVKTTVLVFVVEDDFLIRQMLQDALEDGGYEVTAAFDGEDAVAMLEAKARDIRVLVTDVNLSPGKLTGWEVAKHARELKPDVPVIYITGGSGHEWASKGVPDSILLEKPFTPAQAVTAVSQLLNVAGASAHSVAAG